MGTRIARTRGPTRQRHPTRASTSFLILIYFYFHFLIGIFGCGSGRGGARPLSQCMRFAPRRADPPAATPPFPFFFFVVQANLMGVHFAFILQKNALWCN